MTGNLAAMLVGTTVVAAFYKRMYWPVIVLGILAPSILAYIGGVPTLGISGLAYAFIWFIIFRGFMSRDYVRMGIAIGMCLIYGGTLRGAAPMGNLSNIAWDGHLAGLCVGLLCSVYSRLKRM